MFVKLSLDPWVKYQLYWAGTLPAALLEQIGPQKIEIYQALTVESENPDMGVGSRIFTAEDPSARSALDAIRKDLLGAK